MKSVDRQNAGTSYRAKIKINASREQVYRALTTKRGLAGWWTHLVDGAPSRKDKFSVNFGGMDQHIDLKVETLIRPDQVAWICSRHSAFPEWRGTGMVFQLAEISPDKCELSFSHKGLTPALGCHDEIKMAWGYFLRSLTGYVETGRGTPFQKVQ